MLKRKFMSLFLIFVLAFTLLPASVFAKTGGGTLDEVYLGGTSANDANSGTNAEAAVKTLDKALELVKENGTVYVCAETTLQGAGKIEVSNVTFKRSPKCNGRMFTLSGDTELTLENVILDGNKAEVSGVDDVACIVNVTQGAVLNISQGTKLINNGATAVMAAAESSDRPSVVNMTGGEISENDGQWPYGGGVYIACNGEFHMSGGTIKENSAEESGAGVFIEGDQMNSRPVGKMFMTGGTIEGNQSEAAGGGICCYGEAVLSGGEIKNNTAAYGAGVAVMGTSQTTLEGAAISGNRAQGNGGGVYVEGFDNYGFDAGHGAIFEMKSGSITGNTAVKGTGAGVFGYYGELETTIRISGGQIAENTSVDQNIGNAVSLAGNPDNAQSNPNAWASMEMSGSPVISGDVLFRDDDVYPDMKIYVTGEFDTSDPVVISRKDDTLRIAAVEYANGLEPDMTHFMPAAENQILLEKDSDNALVWETGYWVYYYDDNGEEYTDYRTGVLAGRTIDSAKVPTVEKEGYKFLGWKLDGTEDYWDFENDIVDRTIKLVAVWEKVEQQPPVNPSNPSGTEQTASNPEKGSGNKTEVKAPQTGDTQIPAVWAASLMLAAAVMVLYGRKVCRK